MDSTPMMSGRGPRTKVIVISMADAAERRRRFHDRALGAAVEWGFFSAHTSLHPALMYDEQDAIVASGRPLRPGELGVFSSHYAAWEDLLSDDADQYVVLEDDVIVDWAFLGKLVQVDLAAVGINYLRLYYKLPVRTAVVKENFIERARWIVELDGTAFGAQGYVITRAGARILLDHCRIVSRPVDDTMDRSWVHGLPNLSVFPFPIMEESGASMIGTARFEAFTIPRNLKLKRFVTHRWERWRRDASTVIRRLQRFRARRQARIGAGTDKPN
jgi:glycosyl transferase, family 25